MIDARRMEVFTQLFDFQCIPLNEPEAKIIAEGSMADILAKSKVIFVGDGVEKCRSIFGSHPNAVLLANRISTASSMGKAVHKKFLDGQYEDLITFEPFYLKEFVATLSTKKVL